MNFFLGLLVWVFVGNALFIKFDWVFPKIILPRYYFIIVYFAGVIVWPIFLGLMIFRYFKLSKKR